jgi:hypothetical protein
LKFATEVFSVLAVCVFVAIAAVSLGGREAAFCAAAALVWFVLTFILVTKPPGFPTFEFDPKKDLAEDDFLRRQDAFEALRGQMRVRISLAAAAIASGATWYLLFQA